MRREESGSSGVSPIGKNPMKLIKVRRIEAEYEDLCHLILSLEWLVIAVGMISHPLA